MCYVITHECVLKSSFEQIERVHDHNQRAFEMYVSLLPALRDEESSEADALAVSLRVFLTISECEREYQFLP